ncbi:MAG TPA: DbpA RNA binding domain-containing protein [Sphaerochaeta sp.]|jgi:hypothetical protein|nr:DbpA RNA binding domain-containing protein [Sphaerochaeta sp.]HPY44414.1 DbpA RNA binding domain-containing protein [Sphaerochaeta sp.]HQB05432.1 DbpA RNA binding domain-containing protein [Sphaerochaeta sp.]
MSNETNSTQEDKELIESTIQLLVTKVHADSEPEELEALAKTIKKQVPLFTRRYFTAYLLREILKANTPQKAPAPKKAPAPQKSVPPQPRRGSQNQPLPEGARTLYLNIGKMKRLYAKELSELLQRELGIKREDIYSLRIHDKYSFISMSEQHCEEAISKLNGMDIKGRTAAVSYSNRE